MWPLWLTQHWEVLGGCVKSLLAAQLPSSSSHQPSKWGSCSFKACQLLQDTQTVDQVQKLAKGWGIGARRWCRGQPCAAPSLRMELGPHGVGSPTTALAVRSAHGMHWNQPAAGPEAGNFYSPGLWPGWFCDRPCCLTQRGTWNPFHHSHFSNHHQPTKLSRP